jgi:hypothetical protein
VEEGKSAEKTTFGLSNLPLPLVSFLLRSLKSLKSVLDPTFAQKFVNSIYGQVINRINNISEKDIKEVDSKEVMSTLSSLGDFLEISMTPKMAAKEIETT